MTFCLSCMHLNKLIICSTRSEFRKLSRLSSINSSYPIISQRFFVKAFNMKQSTPLLKDEDQKQPGSMKMGTKMCIALISTTAVVNAASAETDNESSKDAQYWKKVGIENAHRDLDLFDTIASNLASGSTDYKQLDAQLKLYQKQVDEAAENNRELIPKIMLIITKINGFLEADCPSFFSKMGLKALIWYVDGIRDNKSYYLLDGAQLWCALRVKILEKFQGKPGIDTLTGELKSMQKETYDLREELDTMAQIYVKDIKKIHALVGDIQGNLVELKQIAKHLLDITQTKEVFLNNTKKLEANSAKLVLEYKQ